MGTEIGRTSFGDKDWSTFAQRLEAETRLLKQSIETGRYSQRSAVGGFEIEAWLCGKAMRPVPRNAEFLKRLDSDLGTMELARFNFELNSTPRALHGRAFQAFLKRCTAPAKTSTPLLKRWE